VAAPVPGDTCHVVDIWLLPAPATVSIQRHPRSGRRQNKTEAAGRAETTAKPTTWALHDARTTTCCVRTGWSNYPRAGSKSTGNWAGDAAAAIAPGVTSLRIKRPPRTLATCRGHAGARAWIGPRCPHFTPLPPWKPDKARRCAPETRRPPSSP
jgi:hypothetical protein